MDTPDCVVHVAFRDIAIGEWFQSAYVDGTMVDIIRIRAMHNVKGVTEGYHESFNCIELSTGTPLITDDNEHCIRISNPTKADSKVLDDPNFNKQNKQDKLC
jgi:hypothetical protein